MKADSISTKEKGEKFLISVNKNDLFESSLEDFYDTLMSEIVLKNDEFISLN